METQAPQKNNGMPGDGRYPGLVLGLKLLRILVSPLRELRGQQARWSVTGLSKRMNCSNSTTRRLLDACRKAGLPLKERIRRKDGRRYFYLSVQDFQAFFEGRHKKASLPGWGPQQAADEQKAPPRQQTGGSGEHDQRNKGRSEEKGPPYWCVNDCGRWANKPGGKCPTCSNVFSVQNGGGNTKGGEEFTKRRFSN